MFNMDKFPSLEFLIIVSHAVTSMTDYYQVCLGTPRVWHMPDDCYRARGWVEGGWGFKGFSEEQE